MTDTTPEPGDFFDADRYPDGEIPVRGSYEGEDEPEFSSDPDEPFG